ncbi:hypothetical protein PDE_07544 [Penicillium oxalicum 114-2]|uniref:Uncharacterized protein n=1 Tax=Penicillium oxalicum (strain 114-2 / CGMCC 5302) TaxID=933388 RepID=S7ZQ88_PENO1|nr:hypothetical protein PDE_07544 [Penicillium oxalicum 114-2]
MKYNIPTLMALSQTTGADCKWTSHAFKCNLVRAGSSERAPPLTATTSNCIGSAAARQSSIPRRTRNKVPRQSRLSSKSHSTSPSTPSQTGFAQFLQTYSTLTAHRVTAGGRIVPMDHTSGIPVTTDDGIYVSHIEYADAHGRSDSSNYSHMDAHNTSPNGIVHANAGGNIGGSVDTNMHSNLNGSMNPDVNANMPANTNGNIISRAGGIEWWVGRQNTVNRPETVGFAAVSGPAIALNPTIEPFVPMNGEIYPINNADHSRDNEFLPSVPVEFIIEGWANVWPPLFPPEIHQIWSNNDTVRLRLQLMAQQTVAPLRSLDFYPGPPMIGNPGLPHYVPCTPTPVIFEGAHLARPEIIGPRGRYWRRLVDIFWITNSNPYVDAIYSGDDTLNLGRYQSLLNSLVACVSNPVDRYDAFILLHATEWLRYHAMLLTVLCSNPHLNDVFHGLGIIPLFFSQARPLAYAAVERLETIFTHTPSGPAAADLHRHIIALTMFNRFVPFPQSDGEPAHSAADEGVVGNVPAAQLRNDPQDNHPAADDNLSPGDSEDHPDGQLASMLVDAEGGEAASPTAVAGEDVDVASTPQSAGINVSPSQDAQVACDPERSELGASGMALISWTVPKISSAIPSFLRTFMVTAGGPTAEVTRRITYRTKAGQSPAEKRLAHSLV